MASYLPLTYHHQHYHTYQNFLVFNWHSYPPLLSLLCRSWSAINNKKCDLIFVNEYYIILLHNIERIPQELINLVCYHLSHLSHPVLQESNDPGAVEISLSQYHEPDDAGQSSDARFLGSFERAAAAAGASRWTGDTRVITHALLRPFALSRRCHLVASVIATSCRLISTDRATGHCQLVNIWYARRATTARLSHFYFCSPRQLITNQLIADHLASPGIVAQLFRLSSSVHYG